MKKFIGFFICFLLLFSSCEKILFSPKAANNPQNNFDLMWNYINDKYPYFELKKQHYGLDWNKVYQRYSVEIKEDMTEDELFDVMAAMMMELRDDHSNLISPFRTSFYNKALLDSANFNWNIIARNYLMRDSSLPYYNVTDGFSWAVLDGNIGYLYYRSFSITLEDFVRILKGFEKQNVKGLILDIRNNGGGWVLRAQTVAGHFTNERKYVGYNLVQTNAGVWSEPLKQYIEPQDYQWQKPVVLLTDKNSYSASNLLAAYLQTNTNVAILGDSTGGGGALPFDYELPNGWRFRISEVPFLLPNGEHIEEGLAPQIRVIQSAASTVAGKDDLIEAAIEKLK